MIEIYFIRHGCTEYNQLGRPAGAEVNVALNELGIQQAEKTGQYLSYINFDCIYASPMIRTVQTANIIKDVIEFKGDIIYDDLLMERKQYKRKESIQSLSDRCLQFMMKVLKNNYQKIIVVSHASMITCLLRTIFNKHIEYADNCFISHITYDKNGFTLITEPNTNHLFLNSNQS